MKVYRNIIIMSSLFLCIFTFTSCSAGKSAYELAVEDGYNGTLTEWLESLKGADAANISIEDLYEGAIANGFEGSYVDFINSYLASSISETTIVNNLLLSVVSIECSFTGTVTEYNKWGMPYTTTKSYSTAGSGVIYELDKTNGDAYIITNYHVVYDASSNTSNKISNEISIFLYGMEYEKYAIPATYIGGSMNYDIAVLKVDDSEIIENSNAKKVNFADSNEIIVGQTIYAVGNPNAEGLSITSGIINVDSEYIQMTAADEKTTITQRLIRIDAAINGGNSGGGLFNEYGLFVGVVNAKIVDESIENIGYAIPGNTVKYLVENLVDNYQKHGTLISVKCVLGVTSQIDSSTAVIDSSTGSVRIVERITIIGIEINSVCQGIISIGDIINSVTINDVTYELTRNFILSDILLSCREGDTITLNITRTQTNFNANITLSQVATIA